MFRNINLFLIFCLIVFCFINTSYLAERESSIFIKVHENTSAIISNSIKFCSYIYRHAPTKFLSPRESISNSVDYFVFLAMKFKDFKNFLFFGKDKNDESVKYCSNCKASLGSNHNARKENEKINKKFLLKATKITPIILSPLLVGFAFYQGIKHHKALCNLVLTILLIVGFGKDGWVSFVLKYFAVWYTMIQFLSLHYDFFEKFYDLKNERESKDLEEIYNTQFQLNNDEENEVDKNYKNQHQGDDHQEDEVLKWASRQVARGEPIPQQVNVNQYRLDTLAQQKALLEAAKNNFENPYAV